MGVARVELGGGWSNCIRSGQLEEERGGQSWGETEEQGVKMERGGGEEGEWSLEQGKGEKQNEGRMGER